ncbi:hypothetical protein AYO44_05200 [Planctomycetaceae bacterium SCGC AG-212-F19]|nr:hypothetical protein AYO44_05200 [Planctomycetaceae bacterium SCGC AG-212-F19]
MPWALAEPEEVPVPDERTRQELFRGLPLGLLYSGNFGRAHSFDEFLALARLLRSTGVHFAFGVRGNRAEALRSALTREDSNVTLAGFAPEGELLKRLAAADIHLVSLRPSWTGLVVPSKFFGALAAGRPVIFAGSHDSAIAHWIKEFQVGWVLDAASRDTVAAELRALAAEPARLRQLQRHCHTIYHREFSRRQVADRWDKELRDLLRSPEDASPARGAAGSAVQQHCI